MEKIFLYVNMIKLRMHSMYALSQVHVFCKRSIIHSPVMLYRPDLISIAARPELQAQDRYSAGHGIGDRPVMKIGSGCDFGTFSSVNTGVSFTKGAKVLSADLVCTSDRAHDFSDQNMPVVSGGVINKWAFLLGNGCRLAAGSVIFFAMTVGLHEIIAANSLVDRDIPDFSIIAGSP
jgi:acetyltransferase-like isoleucine patch superfamily enzyme